MEWSEGDLVWFDPNLGHPLPGEIQEVHRAAQVIIVQALINGKVQQFTLSAGEGNLKIRQDLGNSGVDDMTLLQDLHEASLLWNLRIRYDKNMIYTFVGSILIAVNPYKLFPDAYGLEVAKQYAGRPLGALPPHLFAIGAAAHASLPQPQAIVISGESGSGKTESTKLIMQYLAAVVPGGGSASTVITEQILEAAPLLEAFGNARTLKNDNSSRFGKYLEVYFKSGAIIGAKISQYLLEKSRIVTQAPGERNYNIFYEFLGGMSEQERLKIGLVEADKYFYLNQGGTDCSPGRANWQQLQSAMQVLGISENDQDGIVKVLATILHLGNIYFHRRQLRHGQEGVELGSDAEIKWAAHLLQISSEELQLSLTTKLTEARSERLLTPLSIDQALDARDAFAKTLYSGLFNWLVAKINSIVHKGGTHDAHRISILDIFGFEDFAENSFEQLCINYANENLQLYFNKNVFKLEQAEYARERLEWTPMTWEDNLPVIHLLAKKPVGVFHLLDDESNFPRANDLSFLEKCHYNHALNELYSRPRIGAQEFGITHYAGQVWYCVEGFLDKNRDPTRWDILELLSGSKLKVVNEIIRYVKAQQEATRSMPKNSNGRFITMKPRTPTVAARFSDSLQQLLQSMAKCNPWFVRCIKPNNEKQAMKMDMPCVLQQLRYLGMLDTIKIRQIGYPVRLRFQHFVERYKHMMKSSIPRGSFYRDLCRVILDEMPSTGIEGPDYQLGTTRVFLREILHRNLESSRAERLKKAALIIQKNTRGMLARRKLMRKKQAAIKIQTAWRSHRDRQKYRKLKTGVVKAQALFRGHKQRKLLKKLKADLKRRRENERIVRERQTKKYVKEQSERIPIIHLDVPAELAFMLSKLDGWSPIHGDRNLVKVVGTVPGPPVASDLPGDLHQYALNKFTSVYCNGISLTPKREPITSPFLSKAASRDQDYQNALAVFKLILRWTSDQSMDPVKEKVMADYIAYKGLLSRGLRDEILVQLCNQAYKADQKQGNRVWLLMSHCLSCFHPGASFQKYLMKFILDNAPDSMKDLLLKKILRNSNGSQDSSCRIYPPSWLEWRASSRISDIAVALTLPDGVTQTVAIDSWTTCEEAAALAISSLSIPNEGWSVVLDDDGIVTDSCGYDYILDLISEKELCPTFPVTRNDLLRAKRKESRLKMDEPHSPKRPNVPPPEPPSGKSKIMENQMLEARKSEMKNEKERMSQSSYQQYESAKRKTSHDLLSRSSALNERYFESEKSRSRSLDDLLAGDANEPVIAPPEPVENFTSLGLSSSKLNERYHSVERLDPIQPKENIHRYQKHSSKRSAGAHSSKYTERAEYVTRSSAMSDTSEAPSLASHVRRVRVPSQASDVDQFLDDLFSPVLDGSLDELSDIRSLAASIRGGGANMNEFIDLPTIDNGLEQISETMHLCKIIKGGGEDSKNANTSKHYDSEVASITDQIENSSLDDYISDLFQPIFVNESVRRLTEKSELIDAIKGGGAIQKSNSVSTNDTNGFSSPALTGAMSPVAPLSPNSLLMAGAITPEHYSALTNIPPGVDPQAYQHQMQTAFLQSAMVQNFQIQQQLLAQNQALQTLLSQSSVSPSGHLSSPNVSMSVATTTTTSNVKTQLYAKKKSSTSSPVSKYEFESKTMSDSNGIHKPPPPPPPMPPPIEYKDPSEVRPFLDPYGRAKTVRIGKWRWPPPQDGNTNETDDDFMQFKMRQHHRKNTPQSQNGSGSSNDNSIAIEWEEFEVDQMVTLSKRGEKPVEKKNSRQESLILPAQSNQQNIKIQRRSFEVGADRPNPGSVGKLKLSSEMRQRLEQVTAGHSIRSSTSTQSEQRAPVKLDEARKMMLQQQLGGNFGMPDDDYYNKSKKMESSKKMSPSDWPGMLPPVPNSPAPPPPIRPPTSAPSIPPPPIPITPSNYHKKNHEVPAFMQRQEHDTFGAKPNWKKSDVAKESYESWDQNGSGNYEQETYHHRYEKERRIERERSRSRSRSRDREHFSESVWDRSEVEGIGSSGSDREREKERDKRDRLYEMKQIERERESNKVYQPTQKPVKTVDKEKLKSQDRPTFRTHMTQRLERERRNSSNTLIMQSSERGDEMSIADDWPDHRTISTPIPAIPAPVPAPPSLKSPAAACITFNRVPWQLQVRKEVFRPNEAIGNGPILDLLFIQIANDVFDNTACLRISPTERRAALNLLSGHGINAENLRSHSRAIVKRHLIDLARSWAIYFARIFIISGSPQYPNVTLLAVSHSGVHLARRDTDYIAAVHSVSFGDLQGAATLPRPSALQLVLKNGNRLNIHAPRAVMIQTMIQSFCQEHRLVQSKGSTISSGARAAAQTLNVPIERLEVQVHNNNPPGQQQKDKIQYYEQRERNPSANHNHNLHTHNEVDAIEKTMEHSNMVNGKRRSFIHSNIQVTNNGQTQHHESGQSGPDEEPMSFETTSPSNGKFSLLQFAMQHFRNEQNMEEQRNGKSERHSTPYKPTVEMVKWQGLPIKTPLLRLPSDFSPLALECFDCILRYCGDLPPEPDLTEVKCVYTVLMHCHKHLPLRDEVYCQLMKQTTSNRSPCPDSCQRAWRLLSILAAYFGCSDALRPYLMEHLTAAASDRRRSSHGTAVVCLTNLRKTARCGGRKNVPSVEEVTAVSAGRSARRQIYRLPGGAEKVVNTRCSTVVADVIAELCSLLGIESEDEQQEFSLYCIVQGDAFTMPLASDEYILDVTTELLKSGQPFYLIFCRSVWHFPLKRDPAPTPLYIEVLFNQVAPDYLEGLLLELPNGGPPHPDIVRDMAKIAALLHRAADLNHVPAMKEIKFLLPKPALGIREIRPAQWVSLVQTAWQTVAGMNPGQVKAQFLNVLSAWLLFGSSFFAVKRVWAEEGPNDETSSMWRECILALNRRGVLFLDPNTHESLQNWPFMEVISTRKVRSEDGALFLDMKVGNLMQQRVIRVQTEQAHEISRLIRQYITMAQAQQRGEIHE